MLFSGYSDKLTHPRAIDGAGKSHLARILRERRTIKAFDEVLRFGVHERRLIYDTCAELMLDVEGESAPITLTMPPRPNEAIELSRTPRDVYETCVVPRIGEAEEVVCLPSLSVESAREVAYSVLDDLNTRCAHIALGISRGTCVTGSNMGTKLLGDASETIPMYDSQPLDDAVKTATLAAQLFDGPPDPSMVDDWGQGADEGRTHATIAVSAELADSIRMLFRPAAQDLRLLLEEADEEHGSLAMAVWRSHTALCGTPVSRASSFHPIWWMRPTYRLPRYFDKIEMAASRVLEPFEIPTDPEKTVSNDTEQVSLTNQAARGLAALCGMILARVTLSASPSYSGKHHSALGRTMDLTSLSELHKELLAASETQ